MGFGMALECNLSDFPHPFIYFFSHFSSGSTLFFFFFLVVSSSCCDRPLSLQEFSSSQLDFRGVTSGWHQVPDNPSAWVRSHLGGGFKVKYSVLRETFYKLHRGLIIKSRRDFNILLLTYEVFRGQAPSYLEKLLALYYHNDFYSPLFSTHLSPFICFPYLLISFNFLTSPLLSSSLSPFIWFTFFCFPLLSSLPAPSPLLLLLYPSYHQHVSPQYELGPAQGSFLLEMSVSCYFCLLRSATRGRVSLFVFTVHVQKRPNGNRGEE